MQLYSTKPLPIPPVRIDVSAVAGGSILNFLLDSSGFVAEEAIALGSFTVTQQAFGSRYFLLKHHFFFLNSLIGLMNFTNVSFVDEISGIFGLGFPRLSRIRRFAADGMSPRRLIATT